MNLSEIRNEIQNEIRKKIIQIAAVCVCVLIPVIGWRGGYFLPGWIDWKSGTFSDESGRYEIVLRHRTVRVIYDSSVIWSVPEDIKVQDAMSCDIDGDGADELIMLCWKIGRFGSSRPFWVEEDEETWSQHIFVYNCAGDTIKPKWMSSYIGVDVAEISTGNRGAQEAGDQGARVEDVAERGSAGGRQRILLTNTEGRMSSWIWDSWGFTREDTDISFVVFGDNLIHEPIYQYGLHNIVESSSDDAESDSVDSNIGSAGRDFKFLFKNKDIKKAIAESDVAVINQETPLTDELSRYSGYPRFGTPAGVGEAIADAGFNVVTCATNHALDQGVNGVDFTKEFFNARGVVCIGIQTAEEEEYRPYEILVRNGARFALFNYTYGTNDIPIPQDKSYMVHLLDDEERIRADIEVAKAETDFVLVFVHWGTEYGKEPDEFQQKWARIFLESKADAVIGTHPHVLQPYEVLKDDSGHEMLVYYSLGNYISAQPEQFCVKGGMARFTVSLTPDGYKITEYTMQPLEITRKGDGMYTVGILPES